MTHSHMMHYLKHYLSAFMVIIFMTIFQSAHAESNLSAPDREAIAKEVRSELNRLINQEGILDKAIERGIINFVNKQQALAQKQQQSAGSLKAKNVRVVSTSNDHIRGNPEATISLVEYSDFECPFCKRFHPSAAQLIENNKGEVNWVYRHFPLDFHNPGAQKQAEASECATKLGGNEAFWRYSDLIYARTTSNGNGFPIVNLVPLAVEIGLNESQFKQCLDSGEMRERVQQDYENGVKSGITGTPGNIFINNKTRQVIAASGALPVERLQRIVDGLLKSDTPQSEAK
ncbi:DsbA family protein [Sedimenticola selenatireducens]|nr:DsbA family protein [Sedimenticola selenatireducens]